MDCDHGDWARPYYALSHYPSSNRETAGKKELGALCMLMPRGAQSRRVGGWVAFKLRTTPGIKIRGSVDYFTSMLLYCIVLYFIVLYFIAFYCILLYVDG